MLELLMARGLSGKVTIPEADANTLFRMVDFKTTSDVKDKGPNTIAVTPSGMKVGTDAFASYMLFDGAGYFGIANTALLARNNVELNFIIGSVTYVTASYGEAIFDTRPVSSNGDNLYHLMGLDVATADPARFYLSYPSNKAVYSPVMNVNDGPVLITIRITTTGSYLYINGKLIGQPSTTVGALRTNNLKVGLGAFKSAGVPNFRGRMYYMDIKAIV
ncbi:hypothetical protein AH06_288 [Erwinia phage AH06]|nr:hypothetical protein AH06_288 [Erwinia phage AH06]